MKQFEQSISFERIELQPEFRELNRDVVLNEHKGQKEDLMQFFASLNRGILESEMQKEKEERKQDSQET